MWARRQSACGGEPPLGDEQHVETPDGSRPNTERSRSRRQWSGAQRCSPWLVLALGLAGEAAVLIVQDRRLWFFRDDFGFLLGRHISQQPVESLMTPHNEHWSALPVIAFRGMWQIFGLRHYLPYALMPLLLHLALAVCVAILVRRAGVGPWPAVLTALVFAYLAGGAGAENTLWAFQIGFIGSCLGGVVALICFDLARAHPDDRWGRRWFWIGEVFLVAALMCSGMGVPMVITAAAWALLRGGPAAALRTAAVPVVVYAVWYAVWGHSGFSAPPLASGLVHAPVAAANAIGNIWNVATAMPGAGPAVLVALVFAVVWTRHQPPLRTLGAAGLVGLAAEYLIVGFGRAKLDLDYIEHSRYLYVGLVLCTPAVGCVLELIAQRLHDLPRANAGAWLVVAVVVVLLGASETAQYAAARRIADPARKQELIAAAALIRSGAPLLSDRIDPFDDYRHPGMSVSALKEAHALGDLPSGRPSSTALFDERSVLQVNVQDASMHVPAATSYHWSDHWTGDSDRSSGTGDVLRGCTSRTLPSTTRLVVPLGAHGAQVKITFTPAGDAPRVIRTRIRQDGRASIRSTWSLDARWHLTGRRLFVASTVQFATLQAALPAGQVGVCPAGKSGSGGAGH